MNDRYLELLRCANLQPTLDKLQCDTALDFAEYQLLQDSAGARLDHLMRRFQDQPELEQLRQASVRMAHLLQTSCLALRRLQLEYQERKLAREALEYQVAYMQACLRRSLASLGDG
ncbi:hypothetical protein P0Y43_21250 [Pseudomonas entomophila]|uniref:hypothetical protein n=1 Tax=Pseudomonas entomophila TaxID=312306 RepID=UPI0023D7E21C|nr:hypothetical protein [Pseudomonas entomophila]MDF0733225.1 hypothetical protein [Pseudomonas entomophila]